MAKRTSLTLEEHEAATIEQFTQSSTREHEVLAQLAASALPSEAAVLRALIRLGADTVRDQILEDGYAAMALEYRQEDGERTSLRTRRVQRDAGRE